MSLAVFVAICVLGIDFLILVLFQWTYGDKRRARMTKVVEQRRALDERNRRPFLVGSRHHGPQTQIRLQKVRHRMGARVA
jgi:hypothetical protein